MSRARLSSIVLALALAPAACRESSSGGAAPGQSASATIVPAASVPSAASSATRRRPGRVFAPHIGFAAQLAEGANALPDLTSEQRQALEGLEGTTFADDEAVHDAMTSFRADLAAGLRSGKVDSPRLEADEAAADKAIAAAKSDESDGLTFLHELLGDAQVKALVPGMRAAQAARDARVADWLRMREADGGEADWTKRRIAKLTTDLALDAVQQKAAAALLARAGDPPGLEALDARWEERKKRVYLVDAAFEKDSFDAKKLDTGGVLPGGAPHEPLDRIVAFYVKLSGLLRPDQRDRLAADLDRPLGGPRDGVPLASMHRPGDDIIFPFVEPEAVRRSP